MTTRGWSTGETDLQVAEVLAAERETLSRDCRVDPRRLADGLVMVKYTSENEGARSHRTSIWRRVGPGLWEMFHHQGTPTTR